MKHFSRPSSAPPLSCIEPTASADSRTAVLSARAHGAMAAALGHEGHGDRPTATNTELAELEQNRAKSYTDATRLHLEPRR